ncbi:unnamed protein product [Closterium sp. NIES-54]
MTRASAQDGDRGGGDGLSRLSDEELRLVLDKISCAKDVLRAAATCKRWKRLAFQGPFLEFVGYKGLLPERALTRPLASCVLPSLKSLSMSLDPFPFQGMRDLMTRAPGITSLNWFLDAELYPAWYRKDGPSPDEIARALGEIIKVCRSLKIVKVVFMDSSVRLFTIANCFLKLQKAFPCLDFSFYFDLVVDESESDPSGSDSEVESSSDSD